MRRSPATALAVLIGLTLLAAWAFHAMIGQRFAGGEVYPPGSSLRTDPLGTKALHDALNRLPGVSAESSFRRLDKLAGAPGRTLLCLMVSPEAFVDGDRLDGEALLRFAREGGRVVVTLKGQNTDFERLMESADKRREENRRRAEQERSRFREKSAPPAPKPQPSPDVTPSTPPTPKTDPAPPPPVSKDPEPKKGEKNKRSAFAPPKSLHEVLGIDISQQDFIMTASGALKLEPSPGFDVPPPFLPGWHTRTTMTVQVDAREKWERLATASGKLVLASRREGAGTLVLATDSYFATNEALYREPSSRFLSWLVGGASEVIFDETHLGAMENPGIMALARRHRLHGLFLGGLLLFALFVWRSSMSLVPSRDHDAPTRTVAGRGATAGLVSLLRRGIPLPQVLRKGLEAWEHGMPRRTAAQQARLAEARALLPSEQTTRARPGSLAALYGSISGTLHSRATSAAPPVPATSSPPAPASSHD